MLLNIVGLLFSQPAIISTSKAYARSIRSAFLRRDDLINKKSDHRISPPVTWFKKQREIKRPRGLSCSRGRYL